MIMQYSILSQINPFVKRKKEKFEKYFSLQNINPKDWPRGNEQNPTKTALAVFDVGETIPRINRRLDADLVILSGAGVEEGGSLNSTTKSLRSRSFRS
jgi:hypothetical protein